MALITLGFSLLRPYNSVVYAPKVKHADRKHAPPPIGNGLFAWFAPVAMTKEQEVVDKVGLDAAVFLRFTRMCRNMLVILSVVGCGILIPVHILMADKNIVPKPNDKEGAVARAFQLMTPQYIFGNALWSHVVCSWLFDAVILGFLWINTRAVARLRRDYLESSDYKQSIHSRSLMVTDIPAPDRSDEGILRICDAVEQSAGVPHPAIARNVKEVPELIDQHNEAVRELESVLAKYLKNPNKLPAKRPTTKPSKKDHRIKSAGPVDAIDYWTGRIRELEVDIRVARESVDKRNAMPYGFATYEKIEEAHQVAFESRNKHPHGTTIQLAPKPNDLIWGNLPLSKKARASRRLMNNIWVLILTVIWIAPNALIAIFLTSLANLAAVWHGFKTSFDGHPTVWAAVQAIAAPGLTSLIYLLLPIIFRRLSIRGGDLTKTARERHVTHKLYAFFVFNNLIVFSTFSAIWAYVSLVIYDHSQGASVIDAINKGKFANTIMVTLCTVSPFWVTWLLQRQLGAAADLAQIINLAWISFARTFLNPTPRQTIEWTAPPPFDYASYYNYFLFYATVALTYATLQPIVLPVTAFYFVVDAWLKKYLLLYVFITKTESGGQFWNLLFNRVLTATFLANCVAALVVRAAQGSWAQVFCMVPLPFILVAFKYYCSSQFDNQCKYYTKGFLLKDPEAFSSSDPKKLVRRGTDRVSVKFGHPALYKPLITPMVHEKAKHVLASLYTGRMADHRFSGDGSLTRSATGYSDIAMDPMSATHPGKSAAFAQRANPAAQAPPDSLFEVVPESELDFAYFKDRAEFGDEHGGEGELYGRPADLVSERSHTPRSFSFGPDDGRERSVSPASSVSGLRHMQSQESHLAYRDFSGDAGRSRVMGTQGRPGFGRTDSETDSVRGLLKDDERNSEGDGRDRWRGGGYSGALGLGDEDTGYEAYRLGKGAAR